ncbi:MAG TPA: AraC family transcriptional regulator [Gemmatimonadaceae bacterium]|jgi:AraC family transcriptional regulator|nr:AraC family transcriptional regulator [Gemmatimonadaceae bacterium]
MLPVSQRGVLGKIAADLERSLRDRVVRGAPGGQRDRRIAGGDGWIVADVICTSGPGDRSFEERHTGTSIAVVLAGTFQYRSGRGRVMLTPGSLLLGNPDDPFECGHEHAPGDRCVAFHFSTEYFDRLAADAGVTRRVCRFRGARLPPVRDLASLVSRVTVGIGGVLHVAWEELAIELAATAVRLDAGVTAPRRAPSSDAVARVTESVRRIERSPETRLTLAQLASDARQSPFHYLRTFEQLTGVTPHQFILRTRLRHAAARLVTEPARVIDVALDAGFNDVSTFNRAFRLEFGAAPRAYRREMAAVRGA